MKLKDAIFKIENLSFPQTLEYIRKKAKEKGEKTFVVTINPEILMLARRSKEYEKVLNSADLAVNDSIGIVWAGKMFGKSFKGRVHGSDLVEKLSEAVAKEPITVGFLGGRENVAQNTAECLSKKYPGLKVAFAVSEWPNESGAQVADENFLGDAENFASSPRPARSPRDTLRCDILFVAFGSPKQEMWIAENLRSIDVGVAIGVGGAFDFISGRVRRAPVWVRSIGLEWVFRLIREPWRIKRQLALPKFVILVLKEKFL